MGAVFDAYKRRVRSLHRWEWAASCKMPDDMLIHYTENQQAVLGVIAESCIRQGWCAMRNVEIEAISGVGLETIRKTIVTAHVLGHVLKHKRQRWNWTKCGRNTIYINRVWRDEHHRQTEQFSELAREGRLISERVQYEYSCSIGEHHHALV